MGCISAKGCSSLSGANITITSSSHPKVHMVAANRGSRLSPMCDWQPWKTPPGLRMGDTHSCHAPTLLRRDCGVVPEMPAKKRLRGQGKMGVASYCMERLPTCLRFMVERRQKLTPLTQPVRLCSDGGPTSHHDVMYEANNLAAGLSRDQARWINCHRTWPLVL